jgi:hypothetical protein
MTSETENAVIAYTEVDDDEDRFGQIIFVCI